MSGRKHTIKVNRSRPKKSKDAKIKAAPKGKYDSIPPMPKAATGRPQVALNYELIEGMYAIDCGDEEVAQAVGCSVDTIQRRRRSDARFQAAEFNGKARKKSILRRRMYEKAISGHPSLLIFLAKNVLGYGDEGPLSPETSGVGMQPLTEPAEAERLVAKLDPRYARQMERIKDEDVADGD